MRREGSLFILALVGTLWSTVPAFAQFDPTWGNNGYPPPETPQGNQQYPAPDTNQAQPPFPDTLPPFPDTQPPFPDTQPPFPDTQPPLPYQESQMYPPNNQAGDVGNTGYPADTGYYAPPNTGYPPLDTGFPDTKPGSDMANTGSGYGDANTGFGTPFTNSGSTNPGFPDPHTGFGETGTDTNAQPAQPFDPNSFYKNPSVADAIAGILQPNASSSSSSQTASEGASSENTSSENSSMENPQVPLPQDSCEKSLILEDYCTDITTSARLYFDSPISLENIIKDVFDPEIVEELSSCKNGSWCLPYEYHQDIKEDGEDFNEIYCKNVSEWSMRGCMKKMLDSRPDCNSKVADFVFKSIGMLCDMWDAPFMELECYTRTRKSLYVMFKQLEKEQPKDLDLSTCNNYLAQTLQTYMCADDACHFDQQAILQNFEPWKNLAIDSNYYMYQCNITRSACQGDEYPGDYYYDYGDYYADDGNNYYQYDYKNDQNVMDDILEKIMNTVQGKPGQPTQNGSMTEKGRFDSGDKAIFLGLVGAVIVLSASFLLLLVLGYKRFRRNSSLGLPVYTKLATDEDITRAEFS